MKGKLRGKNRPEPQNFFPFFGFIVVVQDVRGRFASEGAFYPFLNEVLILTLMLTHSSILTPYAISHRLSRLLMGMMRFSGVENWRGVMERLGRLGLGTPPSVSLP